jgi:hypothetical protein
MVREILLSLDGGIFLNVSGIVVKRILRTIKPGSGYIFLWSGHRECWLYKNMCGSFDYLWLAIIVRTFIGMVVQVFLASAVITLNLAILACVPKKHCIWQGQKRLRNLG